jgi:hypothetical protein
VVSFVAVVNEDLNNRSTGTLPLLAVQVLLRKVISTSLIRTHMRAVLVLTSFRIYISVFV